MLVEPVRRALARGLLQPVPGRRSGSFGSRQEEAQRLGKAHGFGDMQTYFTQMMAEYFAEHLLGDYYRTGATMRCIRASPGVSAITCS